MSSWWIKALRSVRSAANERGLVPFSLVPTDPSNQSLALAKIAGTLAQARQMPSAARAAAAACTHGTWTTAVEPVLLLESAADVVILDGLARASG
jgi:hypothetical protein